MVCTVIDAATLAVIPWMIGNPELIPFPVHPVTV
jgi:hypothetical protein